MPVDLENSVRSAAETVAAYVKDAAMMKVETKYIEVGGGASEARLAASTVIRLDGDSETVLPMRTGASGSLEVDAALLDIHERNVAAAIEYRSKMTTALLNLLQTRGR